MTSGSNLTSVAQIYKRKYSDDEIGDQVMREHPFYQRIRKVGGFTGDSGGKAYLIKTGNPQGVSSTLAAAQSSVSGSAGKQPRAVRTAKFGVITLDAGHASIDHGVSARAVMAHYDNTATAVADVAAGETLLLLELQLTLSIYAP